ncbi:MAG: hypothetical protein MEQ84_02635 [Mesorhizobium sp.]|nr:hypothetical protein [Mesorhizobium sp.]
MSGQEKRDGIGQGAPMRSCQTVVSLQDWRANQAVGSGTGSAAIADAVATSAKGAPSPRFDPALMPDPSANSRRFMEIMSGDESDPAFAVGAVLFFWRFCRRGMPMPKRALALLDRHAAAGDATCILVRDWLAKKMVRSDKRPLWVFEGGKP